MHPVKILISYCANVQAELNIRCEHMYKDMFSNVGAHKSCGVTVICFISSPEQKLRVSYCHHPMSVVHRSLSTIGLLTIKRSQF